MALLKMYRERTTTMSDGPTTIGALSFCNKCNKQFELTEFHKPGICLSCHGILKDQRFLQDEETLELAVATALRDSFGFEHDRFAYRNWCNCWRGHLCIH